MLTTVECKTHELSPFLSLTFVIFRIDLFERGHSTDLVRQELLFRNLCSPKLYAAYRSNF